jgi:hypothetical protein
MTKSCLIGLIVEVHPASAAATSISTIALFIVLRPNAIAHARASSHVAWSNLLGGTGASDDRYRLENGCDPWHMLLKS